MKKEKILIATDAYPPMINGVSTTTSNLKTELKRMGYKVLIIEPSLFKNINYPPYPEIKVSINTAKIGEYIKKFKPNYIHIMTEGTIGLTTKMVCDYKKLRYTTSFLTQFPEYIKNYYGLSVKLTYPYFRAFHSKATKTLVNCQSMKWKLRERGFKNLRVWTRGVDKNIFHPNYPDIYKGLNRPIFIYFGRVASEKNIAFFLDLQLGGTKIVVGDGPDRDRLESNYPEVIFTGYKRGTELANHIAAADVCVFPSKTDTFGITIIEAIACGTPVVGFDTHGPADLIAEGTGYIVEDEEYFAEYCHAAKHLDKLDCIKHAENFTWEKCAEKLIKTMVKV
jgi:glycosyltransferase involved in cell wall biosynthesis